ncbi:hypothetical protein D3C84_998090 [compost metagenome]
MGPGHVGLEVHPADHVGIIENRPGAIAPGRRGDEAIGVAIEAVLAVDRIAAVTQLVLRFQTADVHHRRLADQGKAIGAQYLIEEVRQGALDLGDFLAAVAGVVRACQGEIGRCRAAGNRI